MLARRTCVGRSDKEKREKRKAQLVMHVTSKDHRMNVTDSEDGKYHQRDGKREGDLQASNLSCWEEAQVENFVKSIATRRPRGS
jgi:hypothetical protein